KYVLDQPVFLNLALSLESKVTPTELLDKCKMIEEEIGRVKRVRYGPREVDIDILLAEELVWESERLSIPHKLMHERAFVLVPLNEIASGNTHPILEKSVHTLAAGLSDLESVEKSEITLEWYKSLV